MSDDLAALFLRHVCQTSPAPLGIEVARAAGSTVWDAGGRAYLDLLAGMGVANVGHTHPEVVAAVRAHRDFVAAETLATGVAFGAADGFSGEAGDGEEVRVTVARTA